jgi:hypothetical protein
MAAGNQEGRSDEEMLESEQDLTLLRKDQNGWIELSTDIEQLCVEVERK